MRLKTPAEHLISVLLFIYMKTRKATETKEYRKIPKIGPGDYIFQRPFLRGLFLEGLIFGRVHLWREICVSKSIGLAL